jgi:hypothetical protein
MVANLKSPRPDIVYLRRRLKVGEQLPVVAAPETGSLNFTRPEAVTVATLPATPTLTKDSVLDASQPVLRLNRRQSAIGSLALTNVAYVAWELVDGTTGFLYADASAYQSAGGFNYKTNEARTALPEVLPAAFKKRPVLQFTQEALVIGLRNIKSLKRFIAVPVPQQSINVATLTGPSIVLPYTESTVLYASVVDSCVEFREEKFRGNIHETFRIGTYNPPTTNINLSHTN